SSPGGWPTPWTYSASACSGNGCGSGARERARTGRCGRSSSTRASAARTPTPSACARPSARTCSEQVPRCQSPLVLRQPRPILLEQAGQRSVREQLAPGLARRAVVALVLGVHDTRHLCPADRARLAELAVDREVGPEGGDLPGAGEAARALVEPELAPQPFPPVGQHAL